MVFVLRAAARSKSSGFRYLFIVWFALTACLIVGTLGVGAPSAASEPFLIINRSVEEHGSASASTPSPSELHPSVSYGGTVWSVVSSRLIPRVDAPSSRPIVVVEVIVTNTTADVDVRIRASDVAIVWPDGRRDQVERFEQADGSRSFAIQPGAQVPVTLVFKPSINADPVMADMVLEIQEPGRVPASVPLIGPAPAAIFPIIGAVDEAQTVIDDPDDPEGQLIIAPAAASLTLDAGPYRASLGERLTIVEVSVLRAAPSTDAAYLQPGFWRLEVGGISLMPVRVSRSAGLAENEDEVTLLFVVDEAVANPAARGSSKKDMMLNVAVDTLGQEAHTITLPRSGL